MKEIKSNKRWKQKRRVGLTSRMLLSLALISSRFAYSSERKVIFKEGH